MESQKQRSIRAPTSDSTPARFMSTMYRAHICKYLVHWGNYTKRSQPNMAKLELFWHSKVGIFAPRKGWACLLWLVSRSFQKRKQQSNFFAGNQQEIAWKCTRTKKGCEHRLCRAAGLVGLGSHVWRLCHLPFDFWASLGLLFDLECGSPQVKFWFGWHGLSAQTSGILLELKWEALPLRFHTPGGNPFKNFFKWLVSL